MEIKVRHKYFTPIYGSAPALSYEDILRDYMTKKRDEGLLSFAEQNKKKNETIDEMIISILSLLHRNGKNEPVLGSWQILRCLINTAIAHCNQAKDGTHPNRNQIPQMVTSIEPYHINFFRNGKLIEKPDGVKTYAVTIPGRGGQKGRSFFKAYEVIALPGVTSEYTMNFADFILPEVAEFIVKKSGLTGHGAFRERFGKSEVEIL